MAEERAAAGKGGDLMYPSGFAWKLEAIESGAQHTLYAPDGKVAAHVWPRVGRCTWHVFDEDGGGGENEVCESLDIAKIIAESAVLRAGRHEIRHVPAELEGLCPRCWNAGEHKPHDSVFLDGIDAADFDREWDAAAECPTGGNVAVADTGEYEWECGCASVACECERGLLRDCMQALDPNCGPLNPDRQDRLVKKLREIFSEHQRIGGAA